MTRNQAAEILRVAIFISFAFFTSHAVAKGAEPFSAATDKAASHAQPIAPSAGAQDPATQQALRETQEALTDPTKRAAMIKGDAKAEAFDAKVKSQLGDQTDGAYQISSRIMEKLVQESGGDVSKMQATMTKLMANPQLLEEYLSAADRAQISQMAGKIEDNKGHTPAATSGY